MTEIEFLVQMLLNEEMSDSLKNKLLARIDEVEKSRNFIFNPITIPSVQTVPLYPCQHEYPNPWFGVIPPTCRKCGHQAWPNYVITSTDTLAIDTGLLGSISTAKLDI